MNWKAKRPALLIAVSAVSIAGFVHIATADTSDVADVITGTSAFTDYKQEKPGTFRKITVADLPKPYATEGVANAADVVR